MQATRNRRLKTLTRGKSEPVRSTAAAILGKKQGGLVNRIIYIVGLVVIVIAILSFFGLR